MNTGGFGDLAALLNRQATTHMLKQRLSNLNTELATGRAADPVKAAGGNPGRYLSLDARIDVLSTRIRAMEFATGGIELVQEVLSSATRSLDDTALPLLAAVQRGDQVQSRAISASAEERFRLLTGQLNASFADRPVFGGATGAGVVISDADPVLNDVAAIIAAGPDAATIDAALDQYFIDPAGPFRTLHLTVSGEAPPVEIADGSRVQPLPRADQEPILEALKSLAVMATIEVFTGSDTEKVILTETAVSDALTARDGILGLGEDIGFKQDVIQRAQTRSETEMNLLKIEANSMLQVDPYETALKLEEASHVLQQVFLVNGRLSQIRLSAYI